MALSEENVLVSLEDIKRFSTALSPYLKITPLEHSPWISQHASDSIFLKREDLQITNSFTVRAALGIFSHLSEEHFERGLVFTTPGNLAWGFLHALQSFNRNINMTIVIPEDAVEEKIQSLKTTDLPNISIIQKGFSEKERYQIVEEIAVQEGKLPLFLADRCHEVAAKGTIGLEIFIQLQEILKSQNKSHLRFICPIGSGALLAGCSIALKELMGKNVSIIGAEPEIANDFYRLFYGKSGIASESNSTIADSLRSPMVRQEYQEILRKHVDQVICVSESEILDSMKFLSSKGGVRVEPSAATVIAAYYKLSNDVNSENTITVCLITAGNLDKKKFSF